MGSEIGWLTLLLLAGCLFAAAMLTIAGVTFALAAVLPALRPGRATMRVLVAFAIVCFVLATVAAAAAWLIARSLKL